MRFFVLRMPTNVPPRQPFRHLEDTIMIAINTDIIIANIGVDIGKNAFHICAMNAKGTIVLRERLTRAALQIFRPASSAWRPAPEPISLAARAAASAGGRWSARQFQSRWLPLPRNSCVDRSGWWPSKS
jgi:hypothetical protein